ncbi:MAG: DtxR family transcriptional regulator [Candidatus Thermofonsia Clade 1 bacterium]|jgi:DtxR family Mn-dependent transcriptional regulator|uniref:Manganese transport regulator n=1 Tax=Candidatus Thermofonsia Clade 1 bacterium TaxID=2364210 RepID=A0A2M8PBH0_9CHLR|nr:MAG: DtxR family transcriptional regulator [Candidatus Thermofonsia Clade 1 bacterium]
MSDTLRGEWRTPAVEDFLKQVYLIQQQVNPVPTMLLARALDISAPSTTDMIKRLSSGENFPPLLMHAPYRGVRLTEPGEKIALEVIRHHRLLELYLTQKLGFSWDEVHEEADRLEHYISERLEARIADALGHPELDPHGDPIPALDGTVTLPELVLLSDLAIAQRGTVSRILDQSPEVLRYLSELGLVPGVLVVLADRAPLNDTLQVRIGSRAAEPRTISMQVARKALVVPDDSESI